MDPFASSLPRFDLSDLRLFLNIAQAHSLTRGAASSFLSIPAASLRIKNLEEALGAKLLVRSARGVAPTQAGEVLLLHARTLLAQAERLRSEIQPFSREVRGHVRLFASAASISELLPSVIGSFLASHPAITVELEERVSAEVARAVQQQTADIGVVGPGARTDSLETMPYCTTRLVLAVPLGHGHALEGATAIELGAALEHDFVGLNGSSGLGAFLRNEVAQLGRHLRVRAQVGSFDAMCRLIEANVGIGVLPELAARRLSASSRIRVLALEDDWAELALRICVRRLADLPVYARDLIDHMLRSTGGAQAPAPARRPSS